MTMIIIIMIISKQSQYICTGFECTHLQILLRIRVYTIEFLTKTKNQFIAISNRELGTVSFARMPPNIHALSEMQINHFLYTYKNNNKPLLINTRKTQIIHNICVLPENTLHNKQSTFQEPTSHDALSTPIEGGNTSLENTR
jgi:hypothetical protein